MRKLMSEQAIVRLSFRPEFAGAEDHVAAGR